jgi:predicted DNA-binding protein with PD1-like motif
MMNCSEFEGVWSHLDALSPAEGERLASHLCECLECRELELTVRSLQAFSGLSAAGDVTTQRKRFDRRLELARLAPVTVLTLGALTCAVVVALADERRLAAAAMSAIGLVLAQLGLWLVQRRWYHEASIAERTGALEGFLAHDASRELAEAREGRWTVGALATLMLGTAALPFMPWQASIALGVMGVGALGLAVAMHLVVRRARR